VVFDPLMERPKLNIKNVDSKTLVSDLKELARRLDIDLSKADKEKTAAILKRTSSLSDEVVKMRNSE
jgi:hypothetical protein